MIVKTCFLGKDELVEEKRKFLGYFLANSCLKENIDDSSKQAVLETLVRLSPFDVKIMSNLPYNKHMVKELHAIGSYGVLCVDLLSKKLGDEYLGDEYLGDEYKDDIALSLWYQISLGVVRETPWWWDHIPDYQDKDKYIPKLQRLIFKYCNKFTFRENTWIYIKGNIDFLADSYLDVDIDGEIIKDITVLEDIVENKIIVNENEFIEKVEQINMKIKKLVDAVDYEWRAKKNYDLTILGSRILTYIDISK